MSRTGKPSYRPRVPKPGWVDLSESQRSAIEAGERDGGVIVAPRVTPERDRYLLPHQSEYRASEERRFLASQRPRTLTGYVNWARHAYRLEPPVRLHVRETAKDAAPRWSGDFRAWLAGGEEGSCGTDNDGDYRTPFRCAVYRLHGRYEDRDEAGMADLALDVAALSLRWDEVAEGHNIQPRWVRRIAVQIALERLWDTYSPRPR